MGLATFGSADTVTLPNPLCPGGSGSPGCINTFPDLVLTITDYITTLIAGLAVIMFLWAGILFVTSAGEPGKISTARRAAIWATIGIAVSLAGRGLVAVIQTIIGTGT